MTERVTRILLVGETNTGKTLLIRRLCHRIFSDPTLENSSTAGGGRHGSEYLGEEWGPTIGLAIDAIKRDTSIRVAATPSVAPNGMEATSNIFDTDGVRGNGLLYRGSGDPFSTTAASPGSRIDASLPAAASSNLRQVVELHELGGARSYREMAWLPLSHIPYDGILFLYSRSQPSTVLYLTEWYELVSNTYAKLERRMPRFMLVGTQLPGEAESAELLGDGPTLHSYLPDEAFITGSGGAATATMTTASKRHDYSLRGGRSGRSTWYLVLRLLYQTLQHPFFLLSEQFQEERTSTPRLGSAILRVAQQLVWRLYQLEQLILYGIAIILFGPHQEAVVLCRANTKSTLERLREDPRCVAQAHLLDLESDTGMHASLDEILTFFDILLTKDAVQ